jgi:hypothetical protein
MFLQYNAFFSAWNRRWRCYKLTTTDDLLLPPFVEALFLIAH